jgi:hypothetical protein
MIFRLRFQQAGGHVHCRLFQAKAPGQTWQKNGDLVFDERGWAAFLALLPRHIEVLPEEAPTGPARPNEALLRTDVRVSVQRSIDKLPVLGQRNPSAALLIERSIDDYMPPPNDDVV